jgi:hypothetical protein
MLPLWNISLFFYLIILRMTRYFAYLFLLTILGFASCTKRDSLSPFETSINPYLIQYSEGLHIAAQIKQKTNTKLQMNSGWGGAYNGFYLASVWNPDGGGNFNTDRKMIYNITP